MQYHKYNKTQETTHNTQILTTYTIQQTTLIQKHTNTNS